MPFQPHRIDYSLKIQNIYTLFCCRYENGFSAVKDLHDFWECVCIRSGTVRVVVDNRIYALGASDLIVYDPLEIHTFTVTSAEGADILIFSFDAEGEILNSLAGKAFHMSRRSADAAEDILNTIYSSNKAHLDLSNIVSVPAEMTRDKEFCGAITARICLLLFSLAFDETTAPLSNTASAVMFGELAACMEKNLGRNIHINELARVCGISPTNIQKIFKKYTGMSAHKYYIALKLNTAVRCLNNGMSVTDTAERLGFSSQAHFTKVFIKEIGRSPTAYLKTARGSEGA